ncbi:prephenate dehydrogenase [Longilinea arvoryzae]|uniref:Prephenate dehydrogenase n=1 Tax=Longilinea arvoryzae TaxID=360412 RepID=A0A0S7BJF2_9CHLR|nr:prephenate dehydrogenase/arogenate dehydrogenase family protein [Longilinea arvoryzae]GAP13925.1 prephenate dehydrogenase [Longilinea arvoryzae]
MTVNVTIIGLGQIGASLGLVLGEHKDYFQRTGIDREPLTSGRAQKMGAIDRIEYKVPVAVENANIIILALPTDEVRDMLEVIAPLIKPNAVIIDTSPLQTAVSEWAEELLPEGRYLVSMTPTLNPAYLEETQVGVDAAHADLFKNSLMIITSPPSAHSDAVKLTADIAHMTGASLYFAETAEADGILAAYDLLPKLASIGLLATITDQPSWREGQRIAGRSFAQSTSAALLLDENTQLGHTALVNRENTLRLLDDLIGSLNDIRKYVADQDADHLNRVIQKVVKDRKDWLKHRQTGDFESDKEEKPSMGDTLKRLFGFKPREKK